MTTHSALAPYAQYTVPEAVIPELPGYYRGKVRENYDLADGRRILIASDRISAFDRDLAVIPLKGLVLTQTARFWFEATGELCPNHVVEYPDPNVLVCKRLKMMPVEIVVRDYLAGTTSTSILQMYRKGSREMYGHRFADGLRDNQKLPATIITPTTKAEQGAHDAPLGADEIVARKLLTERQWREVSQKALALFAFGRETRGAARLDPGRHQVRVRLRRARRDRAGGRGPHPRQQPLLAGRHLRRAFRRRHAARHAGQGLHPALGGGALRPLCRRDPGDPAGCDPAGGRHLRRGLREDHRAELALPDRAMPPLDRIRGNLRKYFVRTPA